MNLNVARGKANDGVFSRNLAQNPCWSQEVLGVGVTGKEVVVYYNLDF